ncbi:MAG: FHA domain-containing protein [Propionibacteriaceae bacterium]|jgi:S-DNA-T family DNA segregation ATPase FtsK/SpoIIIE|nr:FHA domain-containing protein [Propionibacteriaceae bacterium]
MKIKLTLATPQGPRDIAVTADATATVEDVAATIERSLAFQAGLAPSAPPHGLTLQTLNREGQVERTLLSESSLTDAGLLSGAHVRVNRVERPAHIDDRSSAAALLHIVKGPEIGKTLTLRSGPNTIGRSPAADITINDPFISGIHARVVVSDHVQIIDMNSANGITIGDGLVERANLESHDIVVIGDTHFRVERNMSAGAASAWSTSIEFNRSPQVWPKYEGKTFKLPQPPGTPKPNKFPLIAMLAPLVMGAIMFLLTREVMSIIFVALSPVIGVITWLDRVIADKKELKQRVKDFTEDIEVLTDEVTSSLEEEQQIRRTEVPSLAALVSSVSQLTPTLWHRRPDDETFLTLTGGYGTTPSRSTLDSPQRGESPTELWKQIEDLQAVGKSVENVPILVPLRETGNLGIAGTSSWLDSVACAMLTQLACLHSPAEVTIAGIASQASCHRWTWLMWLPHVGSTHSPIDGPHLASTPAAVSSLISKLEELSAKRREYLQNASEALPAIILLVENDAPIERGRLVSLAEKGPETGIHLIWIASEQPDLPAACHAYFIEDHGEQMMKIGFTHDNVEINISSCETLPPSQALAVARKMSPIQDAGAPVVDQSDLPRSISYLTLAGAPFADDPSFTLERWAENGSLLRPGELPPSSGSNLRGLVGQGSHGEFVLDLRVHGPHALVGGTTGAGKSEFLQAWVLGMAGANSPKRITFLFVDYKGGAAFAECVQLPHCVGLVTDLSPHLVRRALTSLKAELRYREHLLNDKEAKDLVSLEATGDPECPPSLIIIVDEFAALAKEIPEFVDGVVDVAQRGRSLGMHLIMATQRPAGVIKDNLRANTNLRIALRMADESDSTDVIGTPLASEFDSRTPGRGAVRTGPGRIALFQSGYAGGRTKSEPEPSRVDIETMVFGAGIPWEVPSLTGTKPKATGPKDIQRIVRSICTASAIAQVPEPRKPWLPDLQDAYDLDELFPLTINQAKETGATNLALGIMDDPAHQDQHPVFWNPDTDGNLAIYGASGSGKSATLRTIATSAAVLAHASRIDIYGFDCGAGGLAMLEPLPPVGEIIECSDQERVGRLLRRLVATLDKRPAMFKEVRAGSLSDYRRLANDPTIPRILLLIDGFAAFREYYEGTIGLSHIFSMLARIMAEGRSLGIHVALSAERPNAISTSLSSSIQRRLILRQADEGAYTSLGIAKDILNPSSPAGRGVFSEESNEIQISIQNKTPDTEQQAGSIDKLAKGMTQAGILPAPSVERLPTFIPITDVPTSIDGMPVMGVAEDTLQPFGFRPNGTFVISGMPGTGRTSALRWIGHSLHRWNPRIPKFYIGPSRSVIHTEGIWTDTAKNEEEIIALGKDILPDFQKPVENLPGAILVLESLTELTGTSCEDVLISLIRAGRRNGHLVIGEAETPGWGSAWALISEIRNGRRGVVLQPDQVDGETLFRVNFPRVQRADFPLGRGIFVDSGKHRTVQLPLPESVLGEN